MDSRRFKSSAVVAILLTSVAAVAATNWDRLFTRHVPSDVKFGAYLGGVDPYRINSNDLMAPASTAKVLTAGAALDRLGADYRFATKLRWLQSADGVATQVTLAGSGDPTWGMEEFGYKRDWHFDALAKTLLASGVREVDETIELEIDPRWQRISFPAGWKVSDSAECMGAVGQAFNVSANCASYKVTGLNSGTWATPGVTVPVELRLTTGKRTSIGATLVRPTPDSYGYVITGTYGSESEYLTLPIHDTRPWVKALLLRAFKQNGLSVRSVTETPADAQAREEVFYSPKLGVILQPFCKNSINFLGDALLKAVGASSNLDPAEDLREAGLSYLRNFLAQLGVERGAVLNDGSGLSRTSRITPQMMFTFLDAMKSRADFRALLKAMPIAGRDGTLRNRMKGTEAQGALKAKTGTLDGVYNLAGYVPRGDDFVAFVVFSETSKGRASVVRGAIDRVGAQLTNVNLKASGAAYSTDLLEPEREFPFIIEHSGENFE